VTALTDIWISDKLHVKVPHKLTQFATSLAFSVITKLRSVLVATIDQVVSWIVSRSRVLAALDT
jgi:hypothetical protein